MPTSLITFSAGQETLSGRLSLSRNQAKPTVLFLHGAGISNKDRYYPLSHHLLEKGVSSFAFDFSGQGESTGHLQKSSLEKRVQEAETALQFFDLSQPLTVVGASMSGHIALELLGRHPEIETIILFCPALYALEAFRPAFDSGFSDIIRMPNSWRKSAVLEHLREFTGNFLVAIGEEDTVIPEGVIELLVENSEKAKKRELVRLPGITHQLLPAINADPALLSMVSEKMLEFLPH